MVIALLHQVEKIVQQHTFKIKEQTVVSAHDVCLSLQRVSHDETEIILNNLSENSVKVDKNSNKLDAILKLLCCSKPNIKGEENENCEGYIEKLTIPCMHAMDPEHLKNFCRSRLNAGQHRFICPKEGCDIEWKYEVIRRYCPLTQTEEAEFERRLSWNYANKVYKGVMKCPGCKSYCVRANPKDISVKCPHCGKGFRFVCGIEREE